MKQLLAFALFVLVTGYVSGQQFIIGGLDLKDQLLSPAQFKKRFASAEGDTIQNLEIRSADSTVYDYQLLMGKVRVQKVTGSGYLLTETYLIPLGPEDRFTSLELIRYKLLVSKRPEVTLDSVFLKEQLKGRVLKPEDLMGSLKELKNKLSKSSNWDEYDAATVDYTEILAWQLTLALLDGHTEFLPVLETYRTDIFLINSGDSIETFRQCTQLLAQYGYRQFLHSDQE